MSNVSIFIIISLLTGCAGGFSISLPQREEPPVNSSSSRTFNPSSIHKVAIVVQPGKEVSQRQIEDEFIAVLFRKGYQVASRSDLEDIMKELNFQNTELTDKDAARIGKMLNVPAVLVVAVTELSVSDHKMTLITAGSQTRRTETRYEPHVSMGARLLSVETGEVLWIANESAQSKSGYESRSDISFSSYFSFLSERIANAFPAR